MHNMSKRPRPTPGLESDLVQQHVWATCSSTVQSRLSNPLASPATVAELYPSQHEQLKNIFIGVATRHENATVLVIGKRGSRKASLIHSALAEVEQAVRPTPSAAAPTHAAVAPRSLPALPAPLPFIKVQLHATVLDDDVAAARELCRQLSVGDSVPRSHKVSLEHYLRFLLDSFREGRCGNVPVFVILHDFDLFAKRAKQTLLYNLFDITQSAKYQVCIVGVTTRLDATELLEKRLRSRFSQRQVLLNSLTQPCIAALARSLLLADADAVRAQLCVYTEGLVGVHVTAWNETVHALLTSPAAVSVLDRWWKLGCSPAWLQRWLLLALCLAPVSEPLSLTVLHAAAAELTHSRSACDAGEDVVRALSDVDAALLIACCKLELGRELDQYSLEMAHFEYCRTFKAFSNGAALVSRSIMLRSVEKMLGLRVVRPITSSDSVLGTKADVPLQFQMFRLTLPPATLLSAITRSTTIATDLLHWSR